MAETMICCGPAGISHSDWESELYPGAKPRNYHPLDALARHFDAVEISSTFNEALRPEIPAVWLRRVEANPNFQFTAKLHRQFTHERSLNQQKALEFMAPLRTLHCEKRLGCLLMQFPWSFRYTAENRKFLLELRRTFHEFPLVAEMRHSSWMLDEAVGTFIDYRVGFCNIDQPTYTKAMPPTAFLTSSIGYVRLHGRNCFNWFGAADREARAPRYDYLYSEVELDEWSRRIDRMRGYAQRTFVIANNGVNGKSIVTALQLQALLKGQHPTLALPGDLTRKWNSASQHALFTEYSAKAVA
jgi:uncharacterized protein YecE (DUF72 family)